MRQPEFERLVNDITRLKQMAKEYQGKTIENIIQQMEARKKEYINSVQPSEIMTYERR